jgi:hypothetical protein
MWPTKRRQGLLQILLTALHLAVLLILLPRTRAESSVTVFSTDPSSATPLSNETFLVAVGLIQVGVGLEDQAFLGAIPPWCVLPPSPSAVLRGDLVFIPIQTNETEISAYTRISDYEQATPGIAISFFAVFDPRAAACAHRVYPLFTANEAGRIWPPPTSASDIPSYLHPIQTRETHSGCLFEAKCAEGLAGADCNFTVPSLSRVESNRSFGPVGVIFASIIAVSIIAAVVLSVIRAQTLPYEAVRETSTCDSCPEDRIKTQGSEGRVKF